MELDGGAVHEVDGTSWTITRAASELPTDGPPATSRRV
jgi:hypothetical protein